MSKPIVIQGKEYASVEAMPPDVRADYEAQTAELEQALIEAGLDPHTGEPAGSPQSPTGGAGTPAWGGARPDGGVPVPQEFDTVTTLGPAVEVYEHQGLPLPKLGTPHATALVRYRDGLAYRTGGKDVRTLRWDEIAVIQSNLTRMASSQGLGHTVHEFTFTRQNGEKLILDDGIKGLGALDEIKAAVFALLRPAATPRYQAGEALSFGPVTVQRQSGLKLDGKLYAWDSIQDVKVEAGLFKLTLRNGQKHDTRVSNIPNIELLSQLIGLKCDSWELPF